MAELLWFYALRGGPLLITFPLTIAARHAKEAF